MKKLVQLLLFMAIVIFFAGCSAPVVYDNILDSFQYKPESEWDYINSLSPRDYPLNPVGENE